MRREIILFALATGLAQAAAAEPAAKVNDEEITQEQLQMSVDATLRRPHGQAPETADPDQAKQVQREVLDLLISQELLWQQARSKELVVPEARVDEVLAEIKGRAKSEEDFKRQIELSGVTEPA
ncbi:MAG: SurA N-terminal domain-containing protein, partial [Gammaproteobacteria bacterium]|nr:SurA N-terminal domain-containing protein [Gammaproteobacteria bacterium]